MKTALWFFCMVALGLLGANSNVSAQTLVDSEAMIPLPIETLAGQADLVVAGVVQSLTVTRDAERRIYTEVELMVSEVWKGSVASKTIKIVHGGGTLGEESVEVKGQVVYTPGEEVVVFLVLNKRGQAVTFAMTQGKFEIARDKATGRKTAKNPFDPRQSAPANNIKAFNLQKNGALFIEDLKSKVWLDKKLPTP